MSRTGAVEFIIDGKTVTGDASETVLQVAARYGIRIPTLCHHEALPDEGRCRLCMVEVKKGKWPKLVTACLYPAERGIEVRTSTPDVDLIRKTILELLWARCPSSDVIAVMAKKYGVNEPRYTKDTDKGKCILCGQCIRSCTTVVGVSALCFGGRGVDKKATTPFNDASPVCIGCGACAFVCPTGNIFMKDKDGVRNIWGRKFDMQACPKCGRHHAPIFQLEFIAKTTGADMERLKLCQDCK